MKTQICMICFKPASDPFRVFNFNGDVIAGCVSEFHTGQLLLGTKSFLWHERSTAIAWRRGVKLNFNPHTGNWIKEPTICPICKHGSFLKEKHICH